MVQVLVALAPVCVAAVWRHGADALMLLGLAIATAWVLDAICDRQQALDGSAVLTGLLVALMLPITAPWWAAVGGSALAILVGKHAFGGLGKNPFNPAALGLAVMMGVAPSVFLKPEWEVDGISHATPLSTELGSSAPALGGMVLGEASVALGEAAPLALIAGGILLIGLRTIDFRMPLVYLAAVSVCALLLPAGARMEGHAPWLEGDPLLQLFGGGALLAAFFIVTDPVTTPFSRPGRLIFCVLAAGYAMLLRYYTPYPDGVLLGVLLANASVPFIDKVTQGEISGRQ